MLRHQLQSVSSTTQFYHDEHVLGLTDKFYNQVMRFSENEMEKMYKNREQKHLYWEVQDFHRLSNKIIETEFFFKGLKKFHKIEIVKNAVDRMIEDPFVLVAIKEFLYEKKNIQFFKEHSKNIEQLRYIIHNANLLKKIGNFLSHIKEFYKIIELKKTFELEINYIIEYLKNIKSKKSKLMTCYKNIVKVLESIKNMN